MNNFKTDMKFQLINGQKFSITNVSVFIGPRSPGPIYVSGCEYLSMRRLWNFTDVTLADEDTNSILTDKANRTIQSNEAMQV